MRRNPYHFDSGGPGSGLWKSTDGGDTWTDISRAPGLPRGVLGRIGVTVSPANPERVWAIVEAADGGVFRSDNAGRTWTKVNDQNILRQRAWYYSHIFADPKNADGVYALNMGMLPLHRRRPDLRRHAPAARRQPRSVDRARQSAAHDREQRRRRQHHQRRRPHLVERS